MFFNNEKFCSYFFWIVLVSECKDQDHLLFLCYSPSGNDVRVISPVFLNKRLNSNLFCIILISECGDQDYLLLLWDSHPLMCNVTFDFLFLVYFPRWAFRDFYFPIETISINLEKFLLSRFLADLSNWGYCSSWRTKGIYISWTCSLLFFSVFLYFCSVFLCLPCPPFQLREHFVTFFVPLSHPP